MNMKLLILAGAILQAGEFSESEDEIAYGDIIYPKHVIPGYEIHVVDLPENFNPHEYTWNGSAVVLKPKVISKDEAKTLADAIQAQIDVLEKDSLLNRGSRELQLALMEDRAVTIAAAKGVTKEQVLASIIYYVKLKALDTQIANMRTEMAALWVIQNS